MDKPDFNDQEAAALAIYISYVEEIAKRSEEYQKTLQTLTDMTGKRSKTGTFGQ
jgi:hypothetical protein